jgi:O-antigen/teichoic acid export membrane protein
VAADVARGPARDGGPDGPHTQVRGSLLLLGGRMLGLAIEFAGQILLVRYLTKADFAAVAVALSVVAIAYVFAVFGLDKAAGRFLAMLHERGEDNRLAGTVMRMTSFVLINSVLIIGVFYAARAIEPDLLRTSPDLLPTLVFLIPIQAIGSLYVATYVVFGSARGLFVRRHVVAPVAGLLAIIAMAVGNGDAQVYAYLYLVANLIGTIVYPLGVASQLRELFRSRNTAHERGLSIRQLTAFSGPVVISDLVSIVLRGTLVVLLLEVLRTPEQVADFRAVLPVARQNLIVFETFTLMFLPIAVRLWMRRDGTATHQLYWQSAVWIAVLTFPILTLSLPMAGLTTVLLFGDEYAAAAPAMAVLALAFYVNAALGFNSLTLRAVGQVRYLLAADVVAAVVGVVVAIFAVQAMGSFGGALAILLAIVLQNAFYHVGLRRYTDVDPFDLRYLPVYGVITGATAVLVVANVAAEPGLLASAMMSFAVTIVVFWLCRPWLALGQTFPELREIPIMRWLARD